MARPTSRAARATQPALPTQDRGDPETRAVALLAELQALGSEADRAGMARYGIQVERAFGVSIAALRRIARRLGSDHALALALWDTGCHEARLLASFVDDPAAVTPEQAEAWAADFDSWDLCDQVSTSLLDRTALGWPLARSWALRTEPWVKRAGFALMAGLAVHDRAASDRDFVELLPLIEAAASDERHYVSKAVNWALRNIGKRNAALHAAALVCAGRILAQAEARAGGPRGGDAAARSARWVARDALRELESPRCRARLGAP
jgi:3-methyladenine DNA glycosylase AlkD